VESLKRSGKEIKSSSRGPSPSLKKFFRVKKEAQVLGHLLRLGDLIHEVLECTTGRDLNLQLSGEATLNPDAEIVDTLDDGRYIVRTLIEVKTPFASQVEDADLVGQFHKEQGQEQGQEQEPPVSEYKSKLRNHSSSQTPPTPKQFNKVTISNKVTGAVCQLWAYLTVNHLRYGVLTTFNETYFVRRIQGEESDNGYGSILQISPGVTLCDSSVPIVAAWCYFVTLTLRIICTPLLTEHLRSKGS
jgi:hypothetical protein